MAQMAQTNGYMLDTNLFNDVLDAKIPVGSLRGLHLLATGIQPAELRATSNPDRRARLLEIFEEVRPATTLTSSFAFDVEGAGWDQAYWNDGSGNFQRMLARLRELDKKDRRLNQVRDILIAETAIKNGATLVSRDHNLCLIVSEFGGRAIDREQFERETRLVK